MFLLYGNGSNGKSTLMNVFEKLIGRENTSAVSLAEITQERFKTAGLVESKLNIDGDIDIEKIDSKNLKKISGSDTITVEEKYNHPFQYQNDTTMVFMANHIPEAEDMSDGFFRKWIIIEFPRKFTSNNDNHFDKDPDIEDKLTKPSELSGILNWAIEGYYRLQRQGHFTKDWSTDVIRAFWLRETNPTSYFINEKIKKDPNNFLGKDKAYKKYKKFCSHNGVIPKPKNEFCKKIKNQTKAVKKRKTMNSGNRVQGWTGIKIQ